MTVKRQIGNLISQGYKVVKIFGHHNSGLRILLYHSVAGMLKFDRYGMRISMQSFSDQIRLLSERRNIEIISLNPSKYYSLWDENDKDERLKLAITFDDGYKDNLLNAAPVLIEYNFPFTVFITAEHLDLLPSLYLNKEELIQLSSLPGVTIGSHGLSHGRLTEFDDRSLRAELGDSRSMIEDIIGKKVDMLSYPHGKVDQRVMDTSFELGYRLGVGSRFGFNSAGMNPMCLKRTEIWATDSDEIFRQKCSGAWDWYGYYQRLRGL